MTLKTAIEKAREALEKEKGDKEVVIQLDQDKYVVRFTTRFRNPKTGKDEPITWQGQPCSGAINIQGVREFEGRTASNKLGLVINDKGEILSIARHGAPPKARADAPLQEKELHLLLKACLHKMLEITSFYEKNAWHGSNIYVRVIRKGLLKENIPDYHLHQLAEQLRKLKSVPQLTVTFLETNLAKGKGIDAGGLSKDYINDLVTNVIEKNQGLLFKKFKSCSIPVLSDSQEKALGEQLDDLGLLLMFCSQASLPTGIHFSPKMF